MVDVPGLDAALRSLDPADRALLELALRHGLDDRKIATAAGMSVRRVRRRRKRLLARLAEELGLDGGSARDELAGALREGAAASAPRTAAVVRRDRAGPRAGRSLRGGSSCAGGRRSSSAGSRSRSAVTLGLPSIREAQVGALGDLVPAGAEAITTEERSAELFSFPLLSRTVVVARDAEGLSPVAAGLRRAQRGAARPGQAAAAARDARVRGLQRDRRRAARARALDDDGRAAAVSAERRPERADRRRSALRRRLTSRRARRTRSSASPARSRRAPSRPT